MLRLGHIEYSNCFPVHALLLDREPPPGIEVRTAVPSVLNAELAAGRVDVSPSSSIEFARHADRYRLFPDLAIGAHGAVQSILFETRVAPEALTGREVALPTASATSVVLLRILLEKRLGVRPRYRWFDQGSVSDPFAGGADGALFIGDVALRRRAPAGHRVYDLGEEWTAWTGLPFVFALWQTSAPAAQDAELARLHALLLESRAYFEANADALAARHAERFGLDAGVLVRYWRSLRYDLDAAAIEGVLHYYALAAELGAVPAVPALRWITLRR